ncbi:MAG: hypothetical protein QOJ73_3994 [Streptosporangiaceae bacterium]|nr:hypothetical protein [Streptosporangiaceae bacterium]
MIAPPGPDTGRRPATSAGNGAAGRDAARPPAREADDDQVVLALFAEARKRRRRIRLTGSIVVAALVAVTVALGLVWPHQPLGRSPVPTGRAGAAPALAVPLAWVDSNDRVVIGNLATFTRRVVAEVDADPAVPLVPLGGHIYWVKFSGGYVDGAFWPRTIEELNPATGKSTDIGPGEFAFPSAGGQRLYISQTDNTLAELPAGASGRSRQLTLPTGWYLPGGLSIAVANGIVVQSDDAPARTHPADLAVWNPQTGQLMVIGRALGAIGAYTPRGAAYSLLAWMPANCRFPSCPVKITNTATLASRTLRSPLRYGFVLGGAFSPDGRQLAVFVNDSPQAGGETAELAIVSTATGAVRLAPQVRMTVGEDADWVRWLPGGTRLVVQASRNYVVTAATLAARPFRFTGGGQDINFSAEIIPPGG